MLSVRSARLKLVRRSSDETSGITFPRIGVFAGDTQKIILHNEDTFVKMLIRGSLRLSPTHTILVGDYWLLASATNFSPGKAILDVEYQCS